MRQVVFFFILSLFVACTGVKASGNNSNLKLFEKLQDQIIQVSELVTPTVVHVKAILKKNKRMYQVTGSGVIIDLSGYVLTNEHVVEKAEKVEIVIPGIKKLIKAQIIGTDKQTDLALLKFDPTGHSIKSAKLGDSDKLKVGEWVIAVGNPYGLKGTVSFGIVSAKSRNLNIGTLLNEFIQTDAMIDRGSSGGPLINLKGEVVGINSRGQGRGIGFTIPINTAKKVKKSLIESGNMERAWLGVTIQALDRDLAEYLDIKDVTGVILNSVLKDTPAFKSGLKAGDIITEFNDKNIEAEESKDLKDVSRIIASAEIGKAVKIKVLRDKKLVELKAVLGKQPKVVADEIESELGFIVKEITESIYMSNKLDNKVGVYVSFVERGSVAGEAKLRVGDVIKKLNGTNIETLDQFKKINKSLYNKKRVLINVLRSRDQVFVLLKNDRTNKEDSEELDDEEKGLK